MMVGSNLTSAKLQVNPAQLGPIDVRITVQGDQAQRSFQERSTYAQPYDWTPSANGSSASASAVTASTSRASSSLLDAYA
jgi:hypothetical protein